MEAVDQRRKMERQQFDTIDIRSGCQGRGAAGPSTSPSPGGCRWRGIREAGWRAQDLCYLILPFGGVISACTVTIVIINNGSI